MIKIEFYDGSTSKTALLPIFQVTDLEDKLFTYALINALEKELFAQTHQIA